MDRVHQIADQLIRLYRKQFNVLVLGRLADLEGGDLLQYDRRRDRIQQLRRELANLAAARG